MKLGARVFKTAVAIVFALFIAELLKLPSPVFAGIAAIFAIQPSIYRSYQTIIEQVQANIIGATVAVLFGSLFGHHMVAIGIAVVVTIGLMLKFKLEKSLSIALVTVVAIMEIQGDEFITFAFIRFSTILVGVLAAFVINLFFLPPKYEVKLFRKIHFMQDDIIRWTRIAVRQASEHTSTKVALGKLQSRMARVDMLYEFYKEERSYFKNKKYEKARKLVVYRQMITTSKKSLELLQRLHKHENEIATLPTQFRLMIQERLDFLLTYHEQLLLRYTGKLKPEHSEWSNQIDYIQRNQLMEIFINQVKNTQEEGETEFSGYHLLYILSRILDYEENLEHLDRLIVSFQSHHGEEINLDIEEELF